MATIDINRREQPKRRENPLVKLRKKRVVSVFKGAKILKDHHFVCGATKSGKTTFTVWLFKRLHGLKIFVNTQYEVRVNRAGVVCNSLKEVVKKINDGELKIIYNPPEDTEKTIEELKSLKKMLFAIGKQICTDEKRHVWCHIFIDEVHNFGDKLNGFWTQGSRHGITAIGISQRPADVDHAILTQSYKHVIFGINVYETPYFQRYGIPIDDHVEWINKTYHFVVFDQKTIIRYPPIEPD